MIRLLWLLGLMLVFSVMAAWIAETPGSVSIHWLDYQLDTSLAVLLLLSVITFLLGMMVLKLLLRLINWRGAWRHQKSIKKYQLGLQAVTQSIAALATQDMRTAKKQIASAKKQLGSSPLILLLSAQASRGEGNHDETRALLEAMLDYPETEYVAARSLSEQALRQRQVARALGYAERAVRVNPKEKAALISLIDLHVRLSQWEEAEIAIQRARRRHALLDAQARRLSTLLKLERTKRLAQEGKIEQAIYLAKQAASQLPQFVPAVVCYAQLLQQQGERSSVLKLIQKTWKEQPHPQLIEPILYLLEDDTPLAAIKTMRKLTASHPTDVESYLAVAKMAFQVKAWPEARQELSLVLARRETQATCRLMADILMQGFQDSEQANNWLTRATHASPDSHYQCQKCTHIQIEWSLICASCSALDALEWHDSEAKMLLL